MRSIRFGTRARLLALLALATATALIAPAGASAHTKCAVQDGARWCVTEATEYPDVIGPYGWISVGNVCGPTPIPNWFGEGIVGVCGGGHDFFNETIWRWSDPGWVKASLPKGTRAYVHPYTADWRWVWTPQTGWAAIPAKNLLLKWQA